MIVAAFIFSPSQMAELLTNILQSHRNHFLLFLDLAWELSAQPSKSSQITQTFVPPKALEIDYPRGRAPPLVLLDSRKYAWWGWGLWEAEVPLIWFCGLSTSNSESFVLWASPGCRSTCEMLGCFLYLLFYTQWGPDPLLKDFKAGYLIRD